MDSSLSALNTLYGCVVCLIDFSHFVVFAKAYFLTISIEFSVCYALNHKIGLKGIIGSVTLVNSFSLPIVWFLIPGLMVSYSENVLVAEGFAVVSEGLLLRALLPLSTGRAIATSLAMNMASFVLGLLFPWPIL
jgi:hypothetical protein